MTQSVTSHETDAMACTQSVNTPVSQSVSQSNSHARTVTPSCPPIIDL